MSIYSKLSRIRSKLLQDSIIMARFIRDIIIPNASGFGLAFSIMIAVFIIRSIVGGYLVPQAIVNIVNAVRRNISDSLFFYRLITGVGLFGVAAIIFISSEFALMKYFSKLADSIVGLKTVMLRKIHEDGNNESLEDVIGRVSSDIDFVIWNINGVLTTLLPNIFTAITSIVTVFTFNMSIGLVTLATAAPYIIIAEYYSKRVEVARSEERKAYSASIAYIRDALYEHRNGDLLSKVFMWWKKSITTVMWFDRVYWGFSLFTQYSSAVLISYLSIEKARRGEIDVGTLAGILSASLGAHGAMMNAMWALCIQSQTIAAIKRVVVYFTQDVYSKKKEKAYPTMVKSVIGRVLKI
ncbi:MAG: ABC transporter transmembrane domain-containing protein [Ignisphaera sp.]